MSETKYRDVDGVGSAKLRVRAGLTDTQDAGRAKLVGEAMKLALERLALFANYCATPGIYEADAKVPLFLNNLFLGLTKNRRKTALDPGDWQTINDVVGKTLRGLRANPTIKAVDLGPEGLGEVKPYDPYWQAGTKEKPNADGDNQRQGYDLKKIGDKKEHTSRFGNRLVYMGQIRVADALLTGPGADAVPLAKTIIHEATHRFANTLDLQYFQYREANPDEPFQQRYPKSAGDSQPRFGEVRADTNHLAWFRSGFNKVSQALVLNADSYAWAALKIPPLLKVQRPQ